MDFQTRLLRFLRVVAILGLLIAEAATASAQEVALLVGRGESDFDMLEQPNSLSLQVHLPLVSALRVVAGHRQRWEDGFRPGQVCDGYWPFYEGCVDEGVSYESRLSQWEAGLGLEAGVGPVSVTLSALRVRTSLSSSSEGAVSRRSAGNYHPDDVIWHDAVLVGLQWVAWPAQHLGLIAQARREDLEFEGCVTDVGAPFCGGHRLTTVEIGVFLRR